MSLHGHTRIELTNVHTGAVEVVEKDNTITSAVTDIFNGYGGYLNKAAMMWRGGVDDAYVPKATLSRCFTAGCFCMTGRWGGGITGTALVKQVNATKKHGARQRQPDRDGHRPGQRHRHLCL